AEGIGTVVEKTVVVDVCQVSAKHAVGFPIAGKALVPRRPVHASSIPQPETLDAITERAVGRVVVLAERDIDQAIVVDVSQRHTAIAEITILKEPPLTVLP